MICDWTDGTEYLCPLRSLKIYVRYGKDVTKLKSVIKLGKKPWTKQYIDKTIDLGAEAVANSGKPLPN